MQIAWSAYRTVKTTRQINRTMNTTRRINDDSAKKKSNERQKDMVEKKNYIEMRVMVNTKI